MHLPAYMTGYLHAPNKMKKTSELSMFRPALKLHGYQGFSSVVQ